MISYIFSPMGVYMGEIAALSTTTVLSVLMGQVAALLPKSTLQWVEISLFLCFGFKRLYEASQMHIMIDFPEEKEAAETVAKIRSILAEKSRVIWRADNGAFIIGIILVKNYLFTLLFSYETKHSCFSFFYLRKL